MLPELPGCGGGSSASTTPVVAVNPNPQPTPTGTILAGTVTVSSTSSGTIPSTFMGLSYEKDTLSEAYFRNSNADLIALSDASAPACSGSAAVRSI